MCCMCYAAASLVFFPMREMLFDLRLTLGHLRGASKIKVKNVNKKRMATARRLIFLEFLKASIADLITLIF